MTLNFTPRYITSSITASSDSMLYIVTPSANMTITLPVITGDGTRYILKRTDNDATITVNITRTAPNTITVTSTSIVNTYLLLPAHSIELVSVGSSWYVSEDSQTLSNSGGSILSGTLTANNTNPYYTVSGGNTPENISFFRYPSNISPRVLTVVLFNISAGAATGIFDIHSPIGGQVMAVVITVLPAGYTIYTGTTLNVSTVQGREYAIRWLPNAGGNNNKIGVCSIRVA